MSQTADNPRGTSLLSTLLHSVMFLASGRIEKFAPGDLGTKSDNDQNNSVEEIELLYQASPFTLTTSAQSLKNEFEKTCGTHHSLLAYILLVGFFLFPSLLENKKYEERVDYHQSCNIQASALSKISLDTMQTLEVKIVFEKNLKILNINIF